MSGFVIAGAQLDVAWEDRAVNFERAREMAQRAVEQGARIFVLPEMFATGFSLDPSVTAEPPDGETPRFIKELARETGLVVVGGYVQTRRNGKGANVALTVDPRGEVLAEYTKAHLFTFMDEDEVHVAGAGPRPFVIDGLEIVCFVCYDLRFPELFRLVADRAGMVIVIASWPEARQAHWDVLLRARAVENQLYVAGINRVGTGGGLGFEGGSVIVDPFGAVLDHGGRDERLVVAEVDVEEVKRIRAEMPFLKDRRF